MLTELQAAIIAPVLCVVGLGGALLALVVAAWSGRREGQRLTALERQIAAWKASGSQDYGPLFGAVSEYERAHRYGEARLILRAIDTPTARLWLERLAEPSAADGGR